MAVKRIFVEKRQGFFDVPAQRLCSDLVETFRLTDLRAVRMITRYDVEGLSDEEFEQVRDIVFADPPVDTVYEDALPFFADAKICHRAAAGAVRPDGCGGCGVRAARDAGGASHGAHGTRYCAHRQDQRSHR